MKLTVSSTENEEEEDVIEMESKNITWDANHVLITRATAALLRENERIPTKAEVAERTGLSRQTVHKHMKELTSVNMKTEHMEHLNLMSSKVLAGVTEAAINGNMKAARLFFELMGKG